MNSTKPAAIFDVDDTLCDTRATRDGVQRPIEEQAQRWLAAAPITSTVEQAKAHMREGHAIVIVTARGEAFAEATKAQVESFGIDVAAIYARATGDNRVDWKVKADAVDVLLNDFTPVAAYDDKPRNLDVFRKICKAILVG